MKPCDIEWVINLVLHNRTWCINSAEDPGIQIQIFEDFKWNVKWQEFHYMVRLYCTKYQVSFICVGISNSAIFVGQNCSSPIARPWTQWVYWLPVLVHIHACLYTYIMLCYAYTLCIYYGCINLKTPLSGPQNQHSNYVMCSIILHKTSWICVRFWKWVVSNHGSSTKVTWMW